MATLRIIGGDEGEQLIELGDGVAQIGRARDNDIVLTGAEKGVSRAHAELRFENGRYVVVDLQSQNGTWVNGRRVERGEVPPGAEIAIGEYRLTIQGELPPARVLPRSKPAPPPREPAADLRMRESVGVPVAPPPSVVSQPAAKSSMWMVAAAVVGVIVLAGVAAVWMSKAAAPTSAATARPAEAQPGTTPSDPAPSADPAPVKDPGGERSAVSSEPAADPAGARRPVSPASSSTGSSGRVARKPGESADAWRSRSEALQTRYGYSKAALERGDFAAAAGGFEAILLEEPGFLDAAQLLVQAQSGLRSSARSLHEAGKRLEGSGDWVGALQKFEQARQISAALPGISGDVQRMRDKLRIAGTNAFNQAKEHEAAGRLNDAIREYEKAVQWLPADDPNRQVARTRVESLKKN